MLRMMEQYLGADVFRDGIRHYLRKHSYANTITTDLWDALEEVSREPVRDVMNTWILQGGHPLVTLDERRDHPAALRLRTRERRQRDRRVVDGPGHDALALGRRVSTPPPARRHARARDRRAPVVAERRGPGRVPLALRRGRDGGPRRPHGRTRRARARHASSPTAGRSSSPARSVPTTSSPSRGASATRTSPTRGARSPNAVSFVERALTPRAAPAAGRNRCATSSNPSSRASAGTPQPGESELTPQVRSIVLAALGTIGEDPASRPRPCAASRRNDMRRGPRATRSSASSPTRTGPATTRPSSIATANAASPQEEQRYQCGLWVSPKHAVALDAAEKCFSFFRSQDASILHWSPLDRNATTGPAVWRYVTSRWDDALATVPHELPRLVHDPRRPHVHQRPGLRRRRGDVPHASTPSGRAAEDGPTEPSNGCAWASPSPRRCASSSSSAP